MKIKTRNKSSKAKTIIISLIVALLLITSVALYLYAFNGNLFGWSPNSKIDQNSSIDYDKPTDDQKEAGNATKENSTNNESDPTKPVVGGSDQPQAPIPQENGKGKVDITITSSSIDNGTLQIRSIISAVTNSGTCALTLSKDGKVVTKTAPVQALANSSTCQGFNIATNELSPGTWSLTLHFENATLMADTSKTITVE